MAIFLCIETSGPVCSVALWSSDNGLMRALDHADSFDHAKVLSGLIDKCINQAGLTLNSITAIAVSAGPGSYTGLRIGTSTAKGLCYALDIPLIGIDTLQIMANHMIQIAPNNSTVFVPMIDARRMEVFYGVYDESLQTISKPAPKIIDDTFFEAIPSTPVVVAGSGSSKLDDISIPVEYVRLEGIAAHATKMGPLAQRKYENQEFEDVAYFEPWYTKAFYSPKKVN